MSRFVSFVVTSPTGELRVKITLAARTHVEQCVELQPLHRAARGIDRTVMLATSERDFANRPALALGLGLGWRPLSLHVRQHTLCLSRNADAISPFHRGVSDSCDHVLSSQARRIVGGRRKSAGGRQRRVDNALVHRKLSARAGQTRRGDLRHVRRPLLRGLLRIFVDRRDVNAPH